MSQKDLLLLTLELLKMQQKQKKDHLNLLSMEMKFVSISQQHLSHMILPLDAIWVEEVQEDITLMIEDAEADHQDVTFNWYVILIDIYW